MAAVLAPGLGDRLQFDVGRVAAQRAKVLLNRLHFDQRQIELALATQQLQPFVVQSQQRLDQRLELIGRAQLQAFDLQGARRPACSMESLANILRPRHQQRFGVQVAEPVLLERPNANFGARSSMAPAVVSATESVTPGFSSTCTSCEHPAGGEFSSGSPQRAATVRSTIGSPKSWPSEFLDELAIDVAFDQEAPRCRGPQLVGQAEVDGFSEHRLGGGVGTADAGIDVNLPQSHDSFSRSPAIAAGPRMSVPRARRGSTRALSQSCPRLARSGCGWLAKY